MQNYSSIRLAIQQLEDLSLSAKIEIAKESAGKNGYVYVIDTDRGLDVLDMLGDRYKFPE